MPGLLVIGIVFIIDGVLVSVFQPLYGVGAAYGPGWGDRLRLGFGCRKPVAHI